MSDPSIFYKEQLEVFTQELSTIKRQLTLSSTVRLTVFFMTAAAIYFFWGNTMVIGLSLLVGVVVFLFLISRHTKFQYQRDLLKELLALNETEIEVLARNFHHLVDGSEYENPSHFYSHDIDLFGRGSFYQYLNRTGLKAGADELADFLTRNEIDDIVEKQEAIKELTTLTKWRQRFTAISRLVTTETPASVVVAWLQEHRGFLPSKAKLISRVFSVISLLVLAAYFTGFIAGWWIFIVFGIGMVITGRYAKSIGKLAAHTGKIQSTFTQYARLLKEIEQQEMSSDMLSKKRNTIISAAASSSSILNKFSRHLDAFDQRNNILIGIIANGFFLRDWAVVSDIEKWIATHKDEVAVWFDTIAFFDAYNSLGNYAYNHPTYVFPDIVQDTTGIKAQGVAHPLLNSEVAVLNNFQINQEQFFIITGANMAGKSTFLRTVALHIVMANVGLPVYASQSMYHPTKLITSMRTTDSLTDDESYFFSELKRLKYIVDEIKTERYFIILDEILKGTNSTDKAIGSRKFVDKLVASGATGIIATHDLSLCVAADDLEAVKNYYFDARIEDDELYFDYTFKEGICQNMNASFLLKKMEIV